jgi:hypothetical protein
LHHTYGLYLAAITVAVATVVFVTLLWRLLREPVSAKIALTIIFVGGVILAGWFMFRYP